MEWQRWLVNWNCIKIEFISLSFIHRYNFPLNFIACFFGTCRICVSSIDIFLCNINIAYTCCKCSTKFFNLKEHIIANWFQFKMSNKIAWLVSIFNVELVSWITEWILLAVLFIQVYPLRLVPMQLELSITPMITGLTNITLDFFFFGFPFLLNSLLLIGVSLVFICVYIRFPTCFLDICLIFLYIHQLFL